jgi:chromosome segregation protein
MHFKQIEMIGFKSFADRTAVNLGPGISAVVGPNGCGKSNILDAIRWVLGEQSAKALRGAHMQDVIFNGTDHRPATGMAEVTMTFDNADARLPVDFAEVQVSRRIYRSGESEYLLNKAPCRLRDIQELFMDTGIGTNAYSLIGQGKIDMVLSSKPEDRRFLFEEAAGIIKYKSRKRVAMRKLESAEQNLLRLNDIINEVQRQMRSLKRQVNAAIRHREITATLRELEIRNAWLQYNELSGQISDLKDRFAEAQDVYEKQSAETSRLEARAEELNLRRLDLEHTLVARREGEYQVDTEMERLENQIAIINKEIEFSIEQQNQARQEHEEYTQRAQSVSTVQGQTSQRFTELQKNVRELHDAVDAKQEMHAAAARAVEEADRRLEAMRKMALETLNTRNRTQTELETVGVSLSGIDARLEGIGQRQSGQSAGLETVTAELDAARRNAAEKQEALTQTAGQRQAAQARRNGLSQRIQALNSEWQTLREKKSSLEARLTSLRELRDSYEGFATGVRAVMMAKQQNIRGMDGIIGPVGDLLSTDREYEQAIEAALGGNINNVVVEQADAAKTAISFLKEHQAGRVTFLPLDTIRASSHDDSDTIDGLPGVIGRAIDHVHCDAHILPAVEYLLYNTMIVETIDDAIRIARRERRYPRLVTLEGEVVSQAGAVTGGRTKHESRGILGRSAEIEELERNLENANAEIKRLGDEAQQVTAEVQKLGAEIKALEDHESAVRAELKDAEVIIARVNNEFENLTRSVQQLDQERDALLNERAALEVRRVSAQEKVSSMATDDETLQRQIAEAQDAAARARQALAQCASELADVRVQLAALSQSLEEAERNQVREQREHEDALREAARRIELIAQLKAREEELKTHIAGNVERAKALSLSKDDAHQKVLESQQAQHSVVEESDKIGATLKTLRNKTAAAQKEVHSLELDLSHKEDQVAFFQERIATEYGLALGSLTEQEVGSDDYDDDERQKLIEENRKTLQRLGPVNLMAIEEYEALEKRNEFLMSQEEDLRKARESLLSVIDRIDKTIVAMFLETFRTIGECFKDFFRRLFNGGQARIYLLDEDDPLESGIEIEARPPGKKPQTISLLSGGEQAMTAIALLFSIFKTKPSPFCVLDEVDAPLDDANIGRFLAMVEEFAVDSQFIIITHSKQTMAKADALFGITQQEKGVSQLVSVRFEEVEADSAA